MRSFWIERLTNLGARLVRVCRMKLDPRPELTNDLEESVKSRLTQLKETREQDKRRLLVPLETLIGDPGIIRLKVDIKESFPTVPGSD